MKLLAPIKNDEDIVNKKYVDSIDIGSRNIVTGTAKMVIGSGKWEKGHWRQSGTGTIETIDISDSPVAGVSKGVKITASSTSQNGIAQDLIPLNSDNAYTLSCWVRGSSSAVRCRLQPYYASSTDTGGTVSLALTGDWQYISYTTIKNPANTAAYSGAYVYLIPSAAGDTLEVCGIKLERGNKATDWCPAPEDLAPVVHTHDVATQSTNGFLSASDKTILDNLNTLVGDTSVSTQISSATKDCITGLSVSGTTVTYTKKDGSTGTIATQDTHYKTGLKVGASATATTNAAATNGNVYLNVLDDSTIRDSHNIVGSGSTTVTSDANGKITVNSTDTKVSISPAEEKSAKTYYPTVYESTNGTSVAINSIKDCNVVVINGTEESIGYSVLRLGNDTASGIAGNKYGQLTLYSKSSGYSALRSADTTEVVSHMLPATGGTILNTGTTSFTRSLTSGTKIGSIKINNTSTDIYAPTNTDTKVTNTLATTTKAYITGTTTATTNTGTQVFDTGVYLDTTAGMLTATTFKGKHTYDGGNTAWSYKNIKSTFEKGTIPKETQFWDFNFMDKNGGDTHANRIGYVESTVGTTGLSTINLIAMQNVKDSTKTTRLTIGIDTKGNEYMRLGSSTIGSTDTPVYIKAGQVTPCNLLPFIVGTQTAATGTWTGNAPTISALFDGLTIRYWLPYAGSGNATLNLTLADGTKTGNIYCYYGGTSRLSTHYGAGNIITLTYRKDVPIAGSTDTYTGWWADANYNVSNTAGSTNTKSKIFLIGATSQKTATTTYSRNNIYANSDNCLYLDNNSKVNSYFTSKQTYTDSNNKNVNHQIGFGIAASGNRGIYDNELKNWLIYANTSNKVIVNGDIVTGAIKCVSGTLGTSAATLGYQSGRTKVLLLASAPNSAYCDFVLLSISNSMTAISSTILVNMGASSIKYSVSSGGAITLTPAGSGTAGSKYMALYFTE